MAIRVGTSGYQYRHWRGVLYPPGVPVRAWLARYTQFFDTVELNATFYRLPTADAAERWRAGVPRGFVFAVKGSRYLTHLKRLRDAGEGLERFFGPVRHLGPTLGPVLWQLPPQFAPDLERLDHFLSRLPPVRHAVEFRDPAWYAEETCAVLDRHGAAFCEHDRVERRPPRLTGAFRYVRFHGTTGHYHGRYGPAYLRAIAEELLDWARPGRDAFVYFNNDLGGAAVHDAIDLLAALGEERPSLAAPAP
ncbi:MAG TPA: DUF72 domain-containing protein [Anaeromyxobacter sp.]|nr:DUF72 domain-containing protein [Anaeromyxobacter sp.]